MSHVFWRGQGGDPGGGQRLLPQEGRLETSSLSFPSRRVLHPIRPLRRWEGTWGNFSGVLELRNPGGEGCRWIWDRITSPYTHTHTTQACTGERAHTHTHTLTLAHTHHPSQQKHNREATSRFPKTSSQGSGPPTIPGVPGRFLPLSWGGRTGSMPLCFQQGGNRPPAFADLWGSSPGLATQRPFSPRPRSPHSSSPGIGHAGSSSTLPGVITAQQWRSGQGREAHPAFLAASSVLTLLQVLLVVPGFLFFCEVLHRGGPPHGPAGGGRALRRRGSGPGRWARDNAAEARRVSRAAGAGYSAPARAAPLRHRPLTRSPHGAGRPPRSGPARVLRS